MIKESKIFKPSGNDILREDMKEYEGEYILIKGDFESTRGEIVEHDKSAYKLMKKAKKYPIDEVYITYSSSENECAF